MATDEPKKSGAAFAPFADKFEGDDKVNYPPCPPVKDYVEPKSIGYHVPIDLTLAFCTKIVSRGESRND